MSQLREFGAIISGNRQRCQDFTPEQRAFMLGAAAAGAKHSEIAEALDTKRQRVGEQISKAVKRQRLTSTRRKGVKPRIRGRSARQVYRRGRQAPRATWREHYSYFNGRFSVPTFRRFFQAHGLIKWRAARRIELTKEDATLRYQFCLDYSRGYRARQLQRTLFSDECTVQNQPDQPLQWVLRLSSERYRPDLVNPEDSVKSKFSIMVWAMIWYRDGEAGISPIIVVEGDPDARRGGALARSYIDVLEEGLLPFYEPGDPFMQDNARIHGAKATKEWLETHGIWTLEWPPHSLDLNLIKHVWRLLKRSIYRVEPRFHGLKNNLSSVAYAKEIIKNAWLDIPEHLVRALLQSVPRRITACKHVNGWYTNY